jgi:hypothetical protein
MVWRVTKLSLLLEEAIVGCYSVVTVEATSLASYIKMAAYHSIGGYVASPLTNWADFLAVDGSTGERNSGSILITEGGPASLWDHVLEYTTNRNGRHPLMPSALSNYFRNSYAVLPPKPAQ